MHTILDHGSAAHAAVRWFAKEHASTESQAGSTRSHSFTCAAAGYRHNLVAENCAERGRRVVHLFGEDGKVSS